MGRAGVGRVNPWRLKPALAAAIVALAGATTEVSTMTELDSAIQSGEEDITVMGCSNVSNVYKPLEQRFAWQISRA